MSDSVQALDNEDTSVEFCRSLKQLFSDVQSMFTSEALQQLTKTILTIIEEEQSIQLDSHSFQDSCIKLQNRIQEVCCRIQFPKILFLDYHH